MNRLFRKQNEPVSAATTNKFKFAFLLACSRRSDSRWRAKNWRGESLLPQYPLVLIPRVRVNLLPATSERCAPLAESLKQAILIYTPACVMSSELITITLLYSVRLKRLSMDKIALNTLTSNWRNLRWQKFHTGFEFWIINLLKLSELTWLDCKQQYSLGEDFIQTTFWWHLITLPCSYTILYSYFEKGCRKKCTRQSRKLLRVALRALFFKEIWKNGTGGHGHMFASTKGKQQK